jgi:Spy/CpxP family protein refolding chaperone
MKENRKTVMVALLLVGLIALGVMPALAQDKPADNMQIVREKVRADKKLFVAANMELTESEAKAFWPIYEKYQNELFLLRSRTAKLIKDYAEAFKDMNDETAKRLLDESVTIESLGAKLRKGYLPKFRQVLPEKKAARYYQIENKIQAALYYELAMEIPLVQ